MNTWGRSRLSRIGVGYQVKRRVGDRLIGRVFVDAVAVDVGKCAALNGANCGGCGDRKRRCTKNRYGRNESLGALFGHFDDLGGCLDSRRRSTAVVDAAAAVVLLLENRDTLRASRAEMAFYEVVDEVVLNDRGLGAAGEETFVLLCNFPNSLFSRFVFRGFGLNVTLNISFKCHGQIGLLDLIFVPLDSVLGGSVDPNSSGGGRRPRNNSRSRDLFGGALVLSDDLGYFLDDGASTTRGATAGRLRVGAVDAAAAFDKRKSPVRQQMNHP